MWLLISAAHAASTCADPELCLRSEPPRSPPLLKATQTLALVDPPLYLNGTTGLQDVLVQGQPYMSESCITVAAGATVTLRNVWVIGCELALDPGAAIDVRPGATLTLEDSVIEGNSADFGGALSASGATVSIHDTVFRDNTTGGVGGHLFLDDSDLFVTDTHFEGGLAAAGGVLYHLGEGTVTFTQSTFTSNQVSDKGGAIFMQEGQLILESVEAHDNTAPRGGGVVYGLNAGLVQIVNTPEPTGTSSTGPSIATWSDNRSDEEQGKGGHVYLQSQRGEVSIDGLVVEADPDDGLAQAREGGAIFVDLPQGRPVTVRNGSFYGTAAGERAGALWISGGDVLLENNVFSRTRVGDAGGAIFLEDPRSALLSQNVYCDPRTAPGDDAEGSVLALEGGCDGGCTARHEQVISANSSRGAFHLSGAELTIDHLSAKTLLPAEGPLLWATGNSRIDVSASWLLGAPVPLSGGQGTVSFATVNVDTMAPDPVLAPGTTTHPTVLLEGADPEDLPCETEFRIHPDSPLVDLAPGGVDLGAFEGPAPPSYADLDADGDEIPWRYDCDDHDPRRGGGLPELCGDGIDNDCDGVIDDRPGEPWLPDPDGDGYAAEGAIPIEDCTEADGALPPDPERPSDCDEGNAEVHPDAEEILDDGIDNDCDGADAISFLRGPSCGCRASSVPQALPLLSLLPLLLRRRSPPG